VGIYKIYYIIERDKKEEGYLMKTYILGLDILEQMFCEEEGVLAKFKDTSQLSIEQWLEEKGESNNE